jgi:hypothetical protein
MTQPSQPGAAMRRRTGFAVLLAVLATACAHRGAPSAYPAMDAAKVKPSLVIAKFIATGDLPEFAECGSSDVICMDPAPTWIKLNALETVYGEAPERTFFASTTSHYGRIDAYGGVEKPMLMLLRSHEGAHEMPRYSRAMLDADAHRNLHLVLRNKGPHWLPCSTRALREEITDPVLARAARITRAHYVQYHAESNAEFFRVEGEFAYPRYSLPMARLQAHLAGRRMSAADFACDASAD